MNSKSNYYFMYRINNDEPKYLDKKPFITNTFNNKILGQYITSNWFKCLISKKDNIEINVISESNIVLNYKYSNAYIKKVFDELDVDKSINKIVNIDNNKIFGLTFGCYSLNSSCKQYYITLPNFILQEN